MPLEPIKEVREKLCKRVRKCNRTDITVLDKVLGVLEKGRLRFDDPRLTADDWCFWSLLYSITHDATAADVRILGDYMRGAIQGRVKSSKSVREN